uniref:AlNc14C175G8112 protein n=1 Tax=Albugo laibachii Nc14 TaxID=890382 RepID=F0WNV7_9STRA|nr:AlNc14C175G8112 [Albugo laibachii Nc14]|eukprot:CCA23000.1 AlNc14C175G8112 [Albugo laibachii Nc14]
MPIKAQRARMTPALELTLSAYHNPLSELTREVLVVSVNAKSKFSVDPYTMTLSRVLYKHVSAFDLIYARKTNHRVTYPELEERLLLWIRHCEQYKLPILTSATIREKADRSMASLSSPRQTNQQS